MPCMDAAELDETPITLMNTEERLAGVDGLFYDSTNNNRHLDIEFLSAHEEGYSKNDSLSSGSNGSRISVNIRRRSSGVNYYRHSEELSFWHRYAHVLKVLYTRIGLKHGLPVLLLALYSLIGAGAFYSLESSYEMNTLNENRKLIDFAKRQMAERVWELKLENLTKRKVFYYATEALNWYDDMTNALIAQERQWDFWGAIFYCGTIYTTIGYGNIVPATFGGKLLTLVYAAFGIPLVFFILNDLGDVLGRGIYRVWTKVKKVCQREKRSRPQLEDSVSVRSLASTTVEFASVHDLPMSVALGITLAWMFLCSAVFCSWEDWDYFQAFHFFFVSLTTVGLGDTVPRHHNYMIMSFGLILLGLSLVSMCIQVVQAKVEHLAQQILEKLMKRYQVAQLEGEIGLDGEIRAADLIEKTLDQAMAPSWIRALLTKKKKAKLMKEWRKRAKVRVVGTQTDWHGGRKVFNAGSQTAAETDWKVVYEKKLSSAQDLLKELEQRYGGMVREQQRSKWNRTSIRKNLPKAADSADETISAIKSAIARVPSRRMTSLREKFRLRKRSQTFDAAPRGEMTLEEASVAVPDADVDIEAASAEIRAEDPEVRGMAKEGSEAIMELERKANEECENAGGALPGEGVLKDDLGAIAAAAVAAQVPPEGAKAKKSIAAKWRNASDLVKRTIASAAPKSNQKSEKKATTAAQEQQGDQTAQRTLGKKADQTPHMIDSQKPESNQISNRTFYSNQKLDQVDQKPSYTDSNQNTDQVDWQPSACDREPFDLNETLKKTDRRSFGGEHADRAPVLVSASKTEPLMKDATVSVDLLLLRSPITVDFSAPPTSKTESIVVVEEHVEETRVENRSAITRWIRRFAPKTPLKKEPVTVSTVSQTVDTGNANAQEHEAGCPVCKGALKTLAPESTMPTCVFASSVISPARQDASTSVSELALNTPCAISAETLVPEGTVAGIQSDTTCVTKANAAVQCSELPQNRFVRVPYALDDCKLLFGAIHKKLSDCQSILASGHIEKR